MGLCLAGFIQCIQISWNARNCFKFKMKTSDETESIKMLISLAGPLLVGNAIYEINDIVDKQISSGLGHGGVSVLSYGASINEIVIIDSYISFNRSFSHYATWIAEGKIEKVGKNLQQSLECLLVIIMPIMVMCFVAGDLIVGVLYGRGSFSADAISRTNGVVIGYAAGFFFQAARATIVKVYYAFQDTKTSMINGAISVGVNVVLSFTLSKFLGVSGIALATSISMFAVTMLLLPGVKKYTPSFSLKSSITDGLKILLASGIVWFYGACYQSRNTRNIYLQFVIMGVYIVFLMEH